MTLIKTGSIDHGEIRFTVNRPALRRQIPKADKCEGILAACWVNVCVIPHSRKVAAALRRDLALQPSLVETA